MSDTDAAPRPEKQRRPLIGRRRLVELSFVILGVFIALGLENLVQEFKYREDARELEKSMSEDLRSAAIASMERQAVAPCLAQRLRQLEERIGAARVGSDAEDFISFENAAYALPQVYRTPIRLWVTASYERALTTEAFKRIPYERAGNYTIAFYHIVKMRNVNDAEFLTIAKLAPFADDRTEWTADVRADALQQLATLDRYQRLMTLAGKQFVGRASAVPGFTEGLRKMLLPGASFEAEKTRLIKSYGDCVDLTVYTDMLRPAAPIG